jgi:hypothetical protein
MWNLDFYVKGRTQENLVLKIFGRKKDKGMGGG